MSPWVLVCEECGEPMNVYGPEMSTLVGFISPPGHNHDDNCVHRTYRCKNNHTKQVYKRNKCTVEGCDWVGKEECWCHLGKKFDEWPVGTKASDALKFFQETVR